MFSHSRKSSRCSGGLESPSMRVLPDLWAAKTVSVGLGIAVVAAQIAIMHFGLWWPRRGRRPSPAAKSDHIPCQWTFALLTVSL